jgi:hypothetical protein
MTDINLKEVRKMANNNNIPKKTYEQLKDELLKKIREQQDSNKKYEYDVRLLIRDMVSVLRTVEKKERQAITQQIKNDFLDVLGKTTIYKYIKEIYEEGLEKPDKQKIAIAADGSQILEDGEGGEGTGTGGDDNNDIYSRRQQAKEDRENRTIKKGSSTMPKIKPSVVGGESLEEEEEEDEEQDKEQVQDFTEDTDITTLNESNNIVIEDQDHLREIAELLRQGKAVIIIVNQHLQVTGIAAGKSLTN